MGDSALDFPVGQFKEALRLEIEYQREEGGKGYAVLDGQLLAEGTAGFLYLFRFEFDVALPDDAPVRLEVGPERVKGTVVAADGYEILLELERSIGDCVPEAMLYCEPWELLEALAKRLEELSSGARYNADLARACLSLENKNRAHRVRKGFEEALAAAFQGPVSYIWGPPGTGKTEALAAIAAQAYLRGYRALVVSHANVAVDQGILRIAKLCQEGFAGITEEVLREAAVIRYGNARLPEMREHGNTYAPRVVEECNSELKRARGQLEARRQKLRAKARLERSAARELATVEKELADLRRRLRELEQEVASRARILGVTLSKAAADALVYEGRFDVVLLDEVSMASVPQAFYAAGLARRHVIFLGDFYQLPPIALCGDARVQRWLGRSLFDHLELADVVERGGWDPRLVILDEQRRMHPSISGFVSTHIYRGLLRDSPDVAVQRGPLVRKRPLAGASVALVDLTAYPCYCHFDDSHSRFNLGSALLCMAFLAEAIDEGVSSTGLVSPYAAQGRLLFNLVRELFSEYLRPGASDAPYASTVHRFQGGERNYVIFDYTESFPARSPGRLLTKNQDRQALRLLNVAVSRARAKLVVLANTDYLENRLAQSSVHRQLFQYIRHKGVVLRGDELARFLVGRHLTGTRASLYWPEAGKAQNTFTAELEAARERVTLGLEPEVLCERTLRELLERMPRRGVRVTLAVPVGRENRVRDFLACTWPGVVKQGFVPCPMAVIDDRILWYAPPLTAESSIRRQFSPPRYLCARLEAPGLLPRLVHMTRLGRRLTPNEKAWEEYLTREVRCPECGAPMRTRRGKQTGRWFLGCSRYPSCTGKRRLEQDLLQDFLDFCQLTCEQCEAPLRALSGPFGLFAGCSDYPNCRFTISLERLLR